MTKKEEKEKQEWIKLFKTCFKGVLDGAESDMLGGFMGDFYGAKPEDVERFIELSRKLNLERIFSLRA